MNFIMNAVVLGSSTRAGVRSDGSYDKNIFGGFYVKALQADVDLNGEYQFEVVDLAVPASVATPQTVFEVGRSYKFVVNLIEYKNGVRKNVTSFEPLPLSDKNLKVVFDLGVSK